MQRIEPDRKSQIKVQLSPEAASLPADRESVFYLNVREIPPAVEKSNVLQIALQTKIKLFYRPKAIQVQERMEKSPVRMASVCHRMAGSTPLKTPRRTIFQSLVWMPPAEKK